MLKYIINHQAKVIGLALIILGYFDQNQDTLKDLMSPHVFAVLMMFLGAAVAALDFLKVGSPDTDAPLRKPPPAAALFVVGFLALPFLGGCALLANPTFDLVLQGVIQAAVDALLTKNPSVAPILQADATTLAGLATGKTTTAALQTQADSIIAASNLPVGDKAAFEDLIAAAAGLLQQESSQIPANAQSGLALVFNDIANAAALNSSASKAVVLLR